VLDSPLAVTLLTGVEIIGPILLGAALIYGIWVASRRPRGTRQASDDATRRLYEQKDP
jgi:hypothetical protein